MAKRKRPPIDNLVDQPNGKSVRLSRDKIHIQIVTGSYERILHGITASIPRKSLDVSLQKEATKSKSDLQFQDAFLFAAHISSIRALAISPVSNTSASPYQKRILATGGADSKINIYHLSTSRPAPEKSLVPSTSSKNRSLGTITTHDSPITVLAFPHSSRTKLLSACTSNILALTATRTWTTLSVLKAPAPRATGRPSGDTASHSNFGSEIPMGATALAVHPSNKLLLSVHRGERCLRLWNLVTGKRAGVLVFEKQMLRDVGEAGPTGKIGWGMGEGRSLAWDEKGGEFTVGFERGVAVFDMSCNPKCVIKPDPPTKIHKVKYVQSESEPTLAMSTESGKVLFYTTSSSPEFIGALSPPKSSAASRVKVFEILSISDSPSALLVITASSDGTIRVWTLDREELALKDGKDLGRMLGKAETGRRILCLGAFLLDGEPEGEDTEEVESKGSGDEYPDIESDEDNDDEHENNVDDNDDSELYEDEEFNGLD